LKEGDFYMPLTTLAGHPLHPQLVAFPIGLLSYSCVMDVMHSLTGRPEYADTAYHTMVGGYVGGLAAGAAGAADYQAIPPQMQSKKVANLHAALNLGVMGLYSLNLLLRSRRSRPGPLPMLLSLLGTAGLMASAWYGGELVYKLGMPVKPVMEEDGPPQKELKLPGDEKLEEAFIGFQERYAPQEGC
jgi:uncharacterized membrane protein